MLMFLCKRNLLLNLQIMNCMQSLHSRCFCRTPGLQHHQHHLFIAAASESATNNTSNVSHDCDHNAYRIYRHAMHRFHNTYWARQFDTDAQSEATINSTAVADDSDDDAHRMYREAMQLITIPNQVRRHKRSHSAVCPICGQTLS